MITFMEVVGATVSGEGDVPVETARESHRTDAHLTKKQRMVCQLLVHDVTPREFADRLGIELSTVRTHMHRATLSCGVRTNADLIAKLFRDGDIE